jgi:hypothetical protein
MNKEESTIRIDMGPLPAFLIETRAVAKTILENQIEILSILNKKSIEDVRIQIDERVNLHTENLTSEYDAYVAQSKAQDQIGHE